MRRLQDEPQTRSEARAARSLGKTMTEWDELDDYDRSWAMAAEASAGLDSLDRCEACGGPKAECQDPDNQHAYEVEFRRCFRSQAIREAEKKRSDLDGVLTVVSLNPAKKKSALKKG